MSTRSALRYGHHSRFGPPIIADDLATEREKLIAANQAFAAALKQALHDALIEAAPIPTIRTIRCFHAGGAVNRR